MRPPERFSPVRLAVLAAPDARSRADIGSLILRLLVSDTLREIEGRRRPLTDENSAPGVAA